MSDELTNYDKIKWKSEVSSDDRSDKEDDLLKVNVFASVETRQKTPRRRSWRSRGRTAATTEPSDVSKGEDISSSEADSDKDQSHSNVDVSANAIVAEGTSQIDKKATRRRRRRRRRRSASLAGSPGICEEKDISSSEADSDKDQSHSDADAVAAGETREKVKKTPRRHRRQRQRRPEITTSTDVSTNAIALEEQDTSQIDKKTPRRRRRTRRRRTASTAESSDIPEKKDISSSEADSDKDQSHSDADLSVDAVAAGETREEVKKTPRRHRRQRQHRPEITTSTDRQDPENPQQISAEETKGITIAAQYAVMDQAKLVVEETTSAAAPVTQVHHHHHHYHNEKITGNIVATGPNANIEQKDTTTIVGELPQSADEHEGPKQEPTTSKVGELPQRAERPKQEPTTSKEPEISKGQEQHVMISYSWAQQKTALMVKDGLEKLGYKVWIDVEKMTGSLLNSMADAIENSEIVLMCVSEAYKNNKNCNLEAEYIRKKRKPFIPLLFESGYEADGWLGLLLGEKLYFDFSDIETFESKLAELDKEIKQTILITKKNETSKLPSDKLISPTKQQSEPVEGILKGTSRQTTGESTEKRSNASEDIVVIPDESFRSGKGSIHRRLFADRCARRFRKAVNKRSFAQSMGRIVDSFKEQKLCEPDFEANPRLKKLTRFYHGEMEPKTSDYKKERSCNISSQPDSEGNMISLEELIEEISKGDSRYIALVGQAGSGKTTTMRRFVRDIIRANKPKPTKSEKPIRGLLMKAFKKLKARFKLVHFMNIKDLGVESLQLTTRDLLFKRMFPELSEDELQYGYDWMIKNQNEVLFVFDGLDQASWEAPADFPKIRHNDKTSTGILMSNILSGHLFPKTKILISSREHSVASLSGMLRPEVIVAMMGLRPDDVEKVFNALMGDDEEEADNFNTRLSPAMLPLCSIPLFLVFNAIIHKTDPTIRPETMSAVLLEILRIFIRSDHALQKRNIVLIIKNLKRMAFIGTLERRVTFIRTELAKYDLDPKIVCDFMINVPGSSALSQNLFDGDYRIFFSHQTIQEIFTALYICDKHVEDFVSFAQNELVEPHWSVVRRFVCGLLSNPRTSKYEFFKIPDRKEKWSIFKETLRHQAENAKKSSDRLELLALLYESQDKDLIRFLVHDIDFVNEAISPAGMHAIASVMRCCQHISMFRLEDCNLDDELLEILERTTRNSQLQVEEMVFGEINGATFPFHHFFEIGRRFQTEVAKARSSEMQRNLQEILDLSKSPWSVKIEEITVTGDGADLMGIAIGPESQRDEMNYETPQKVEDITSSNSYEASKKIEKMSVIDRGANVVGIAIGPISQKDAVNDGARRSNLEDIGSFNSNETFGMTHIIDILDGGDFPRDCASIFNCFTVSVLSVRHWNAEQMTIFSESLQSAKVDELVVDQVESATLPESFIRTGRRFLAKNWSRTKNENLQGILQLSKLPWSVKIEKMSVIDRGANVVGIAIGPISQKDAVNDGAQRSILEDIGSSNSNETSGMTHIIDILDSGDFPRDCASICNCFTVSVLSVRRWKAKQMTTFSESLQSAKIRLLEVSNNWHLRLNNGFTIVGSAVARWNVEQVLMQYCNLKRDDMEAFVNSVGDTKIRLLDVSRNDKLRLNNGFTIVGSAVARCNVQEVLMQQCNLKGDDMKDFMDSVGDTKIRLLDVSGNTGLKRNNGFNVVGSAVKQCELEQVLMQFCNLEGNDMKDFMTGVGDTKIRLLNVSVNPELKRNNGFNVVGSAVKQCEVEQVLMLRCDLEGNAMKDFMTGVGDTKIKKLDVSWNSSLRSDRGFFFVGSVVSRCRVEELSLQRCQSTSSELKDFQEGAATAKIRLLDLSGSEGIKWEPRDEELSEIIRIIQRNGVETLVMKYCIFKPDQLENFKKSIPDNVDTKY